jgi:transcriptional regulator with XRE-family HTH domain
MRDRRLRKRLGVSEISSKIGINQGQVSRILQGKFRKLDGHAMQLCQFLGVDLSEISAGKSREAELALEKALYRLWDGSQEDANRLVRLLEDLKELRRK